MITIEKLEIRYDNTDAEIEKAYKLFQRKYMLRRSVLFTIVYAIAAAVGVDLMIANSSNIAGYILLVIGLGMAFSTWARPYYARKKLMKTLESFDKETYRAVFSQSSILIDTEILPEQETEVVAVTAQGVMTVGADADIPEAEEKEIKHEKTRIELQSNRLDSMETEEAFLLFLNRSLIYIFPKRCLHDGQEEQLRDYFDDKNI